MDIRGSYAEHREYSRFGRSRAGGSSCTNAWHYKYEIPEGRHSAEITLVTQIIARSHTLFPRKAEKWCWEGMEGTCLI